MKMQTYEYVDFLKTQANFEFNNGKLYINSQVFTHYQINIKYTELPDNLVFNCLCNLSGSKFTSLPNDIVLNGSLSVSHSNIKTLPSSPPLTIMKNLSLSETNIVIPFGTYVNNTVGTTCSLYDHIDGLKINGYFACSGILS